MATLIGRVGIVDKGTWNSGSTYDTLDTITYNNSIYIAKQSTPAGTLPTNTTYWQLAMDSSSLQPKTMSSPVTIGGESKTTVEAAIGALNDTKANQTAISSVETTNTAVSAHAVGSYFINASGQFVKATSAISVGDTISGSNTAVSSVEEAKASKVSGATPGNFAALDVNGDLIDSGLNIDVKGVDLDNAGVALIKIGSRAKAICVQQTVNITISTSSYTKVGTLPNGYNPSLKIETEIAGNDRTLMLKIDTNGDISLKMLTGFSATTMNIFAPFVWYS